MNLLNTLVGHDGFRLRGTAMSRVDGFSDVVFGFALTLIVASLEVPKTYDELHATLLGFVPFAICFMFLMMVWLSHYQFFRRFGLHDMRTILINAGLLFTVLFYVYPLKFLFTLVGAQFVHMHYQHEPFSSQMQVRELAMVYALGFFAIYLMLTLLNLNAWRQREGLGLNTLERLILKSAIIDLSAVSSVGLMVMIAARLLPPDHALMACYLFMLIGVWKIVSGTYYGKKIRLERAHTSSEPLPASHAA